MRGGGGIATSREKGTKGVATSREKGTRGVATSRERERVGGEGLWSYITSSVTLTLRSQHLAPQKKGKK